MRLKLPTREEMAEIEASSRLYAEDGAHFMTAFVLIGADDETPMLAPVTFVLAGGKLVTIRYVEPKAFVAYANQAARDVDFCTGGVSAFLGLLDALVDYGGTLIFVSHDRQFVSSLATRIIDMQPGAEGLPAKVVDYRGTYDEYLASQGVE